jgi:hypothetical protein
MATGGGQQEIEEGYLDVPGGKAWYRARSPGGPPPASHRCFAEQPEEFNQVINSFMT